MTNSTKHRLVLAVWLFALWTAIASVFAIQWYTYDSLHGHVGPWHQYLRWAVEQWYTWAAISPLTLWLAAKRPIHPRRLWQSLTLHVIASILIALIAIYIQAVLSHFLNTEKWLVRDYVALYLTKDVAINIATYWALTGLAQTLFYYRENTNRQLRETQLEKQLAQAQLQVLRMQLQPHFLFNTLHAIGSLIHEDPTSAEQMLLDLSSLLRVFLDRESFQHIPLQRELHLVDLYLSIQRIRFRDRLIVQSHIAPETVHCSVPSLILQPIVENAIVHGIAKNPGQDAIEITTALEHGQLVVEISNSNSLLPNELQSNGGGSGVGLSNTRQRLAQIYDGSASLSISARSPRGVVCRIVMPFMKVTSVLTQEELLSL